MICCWCGLCAQLHAYIHIQGQACSVEAVAECYWGSDRSGGSHTLRSVVCTELAVCGSACGCIKGLHVGMHVYSWCPELTG